MHSRSLAAACALWGLALPSLAHSQTPSFPNVGGPEPAPTAVQHGAVDLETVRAATRRYADVNAALADGYLTDPAGRCVTADMMGLPAEAGAMGIHYFRPDLLGVTAVEPRVAGSDVALDWERPELLLYEPQADGTAQLVGVEYLVFERPWREAGNVGPPAFLGNPFTHMEDDPATELDEGHGFEPHYDLHVWLFRENPAGTFTGFNPAVSCAHAAPTMEHASH